MKNKRDLSIDNSKAILIFLVVFGHFLELIDNSSLRTLILIIYLFHMPVFIYFSGRVAKYDPSKMLKKILIPYLVIQLVSFVFYRFFSPTFEFMLVTPYASLWYMISLFLWYLSIPFIELCKKPKTLLFISILLALLIGYDDTAATCLSISRTILFFPFFLLGYYTKKHDWFNGIKNNRLIKPLSLVLLIICFGIIIKYNNYISIPWLYGSAGYRIYNYDVLTRLFIGVGSFVCLLNFIIFVPNKKYFFTTIGSKTLSIYLLHFYFVYLLCKFESFFISFPLIKSVILSFVIVFILSRKVFIDLFEGTLFLKVKEMLNNEKINFQKHHI